MQFQLVIATLLLNFFYGIISQTVVPGNCNFVVQQDFNLTAYLGKWHEIVKSNFFAEADAICVEAIYSDFGNGSIEVYNTDIINATGQFSGIIGNARPLDGNNTDGKLLVSFPSVGAYDSPYWVIETDYVNYSIVLSCRETGNNSSSRILWFLSRQKDPSASVRDYVRNKMFELELAQGLVLKPTFQTGCPDTNLIV